MIVFAEVHTFSQSQIQSDYHLSDSYADHSKMKTESAFALEWVSLGPTLNSARVEAVQSHPNQPGTIYTAFGSGGLWKTVNNGLNWKPIFENMPALGIGDIALAPSNPNIVYVGTGESLKKPRNFTMTGNGVYRSNDGGESWTHLGLDDTWHIGEIVVHPENPDIVLVAALGHFWSSNATRGIFRTEDGGKTWNHVLYIDEFTGANDIVFAPSNPNFLYATVWENYPGVNGAKSGIYASKDGGVSWTKSNHGLSIDNNTGRIGISASHQDANVAYAFIDQRNRGEDRGAGEIYRTENGGQNWFKTHKDEIWSLSGLGWYFMDIYVNPLDDAEIYGLGVRLLHSKDAGKTFEFIGGEINHLNPSPAQTLHLDHCEMWINPLNPNELLLGNDGGLYQSYDKGQSWLHLNNIPTGEFYDIEIDNEKPYKIYGGTQDDATVVGAATEYNPSIKDPWKYLWIDAWSGGDGCITLVDPEDSNTIYFSMQNGGARRMDLSKGSSVSIRPRFSREENRKLKYNFITPYFISPHASNRLYMAGNFIMKSEDKGDQWTKISPNLIKENQSKKGEIAAGAMAESTLEKDLLYVGTDKGTLWVSTDGGNNWENRSKNLPPNYIRSISPSKHQKGRVYIQLTGMNYDDLGAYIFVSEDYGETWQSLKNNLPNQPVNVVLEDPNFEDIIYAGTLRGVYISQDRGQSWQYLGVNMPDISIGDIEIDRPSKDLVVASHGRGIYRLNLRPIYQSYEENISSLYLFDVPDGKSPKRRDTHNDIEASSIEKITISFYLTRKEQVNIQVTNLQDSIVWSQNIDGVAGLNQFRWDLEISQEQSLLPYFVHYKKYLDPGLYKFNLISSEGKLSKQLIVRDLSDE